MKNILSITVDYLYNYKNEIQDKYGIGIPLARNITELADILCYIENYGFKQSLLSGFWDLLSKLDNGEDYSGETAPYCGHHYSGFENKYLSSHFHEGDGGGKTKINLFGYKLFYDNIESPYYYIAK